MSDRLGDLGQETNVVLVTFSQPDRVHSYRSRNSLGYEVLIDPTRDGYRAFGLGRGSYRRVWGWKAARRYAQLFRSDGFRGLRRPVEDTLQLGGDFIVAPDGTLVYGFWGAGPDDRPSVDDLVAAVETL